ncbi:MAG: dTDP-4-dehydrorhamnose 3,5-epimerase family protein [Candidatus Hodarchaeales archaeon]|jgi:dTDP-4-dehydrorhamnose 3,5-epimerase
MTYNKDKHFENRGSLYTIYDSRDFEIEFVQDKISKSYQGVIRGFHGDDITWKLITCLYGRIKLITYDVDTNLKKEYILDGDDTKSTSVLVPPRVLNGHQCLSSHCIFHYKWSHYYTGPESQWSVYYNDSTINPQWNWDIAGIISDRDMNANSLIDLQKRLGIK